MDSAKLQDLVDNLPQGEWVVHENHGRGRNLFHTVISDDWDILASTWGKPNLPLANLIALAPALAREVISLRERIAVLDAEKEDK